MKRLALSGTSKTVINSLAIMKKNMLPYILGLVLMAVVYGLALDVFLSVIFQRMIDAALVSDFSMLKRCGVILALLLAGACIACPLLSFMVQYAIQKTITRTRNLVFARVIRQPVPYFENNHSGRIISAMTGDLALMEQLYFWPVFRTFLLITIGIGAIALLFAYSPLICLISVSFSLITIAVNYVYARIIKKKAGRSQEILSKLNGTLVDMIDGAKVFRIFRVNQFLLDRFFLYNRQYCDARVSYARREGELSGIVSLINFLGYALVCSVGLYLAFANRLSIGGAIACTELIMEMNFVINEFSSVVGQTQFFATGAERVLSLLEEEEEQGFSGQFWCEQGSCYTADNALFRFENVTCRYNDGDSILECSSFSIPMGKKIGIIGKSGSGKSTLAGLILGFYPIADGAILYKGSSLVGIGKDEIRSKVSYVPQEPFLFADTIRANIAPSGGSEAEITRAAKLACIHDFVITLPNGYDTMIDENGSSLSGGQKQRIAIARALAKKSELIIFDEATSALQCELEDEIMDNINSAGLLQTMVFITHRIESLAKMDEVLLVRDKKITPCPKEDYRTVLLD